MIAWCARGITGWLIRCGAVRESDRELYVYAAYSFLITVSPLFLTILIGTLLGKTWQSIVLILPFLLIRKFSGGVHAKHAIVCFICSCLLLLLCIELSGHIEGGSTLAAVTAAAMVSLFLLSPVKTKKDITAWLQEFLRQHSGCLRRYFSSADGRTRRCAFHLGSF